LIRLRWAPLAPLLIVMVACAGSSAGGHLPEANEQPGFASSAPTPLPSGLVTAGQLTIAILPTLPVQQYLDHQKNPAGFDIDLAKAIGSQLQLKVRFNPVNSEDEIVPGLALQKRSYDMGIADQVETPAITSGAGTVRYFTTGQSILTPSGDQKTSGLGSLCGAKVGALKDTQGEVEALRQNESTCSSNKIEYKAYDDGSKAVADLQSGKLTAYVDEYPSAVYFARVYGGLRVVPNLIALTTEVMVFAFNDKALRDAVAAALDRLRNDGTYAGLLRTWGLDQGAVTNASPTPSAGTSPIPSPSPSPS
jgi:polar amino acid transport system substrate-binding protein